MAELDMVLAQAAGLKTQIDEFLKSSTYDKYVDLRELHVDAGDSERLSLRLELRWIMGKLADAADSIDYLSRPVKETGTLHRDGNGAYVTGQGYQYRSGSLIEALILKDAREAPRWVQTKVEYDGDDYYLLGYDDIPMEGLCVRVR